MKSLQAVAFLATLFLVPLSSQASKGINKKIHRPVIAFLRHGFKGKDQKALKQVGIQAMAKVILGEHYKMATPEQIKKTEGLIEKQLKYAALPMIKKYFKTVDGVPLGTPQKVKNQYHVKSSALYGGGSAIDFKWVLEGDKKFQITDIIDKKGKSSMETNAKNAQNLIKKHGIDGFLKKFGEKVEDLK
jgi:ABC-type transporter MlaC component